jgi:hypothetical protein
MTSSPGARLLGFVFAAPPLTSAFNARPVSRRDHRSDNGNYVDEKRTKDQADDAVESTASFSAPYLL